MEDGVLFEIYFQAENQTIYFVEYIDIRLLNKIYRNLIGACIWLYCARSGFQSNNAFGCLTSSGIRETSGCQIVRYPK